MKTIYCIEFDKSIKSKLEIGIDRVKNWVDSYTGKVEYECYEIQEPSNPFPYLLKLLWDNGEVLVIMADNIKDIIDKEFRNCTLIG